MGREIKHHTVNTIEQFSQYWTFQGFYRILPGSDDIDLYDVYRKCICHVTFWVRKRVRPRNLTSCEEVDFLNKYPDPSKFSELELFVPMLNEGNVISEPHVLNKKYDIKLVATRDGEWAIRIVEPNNKKEATIRSRVFITNIGIKMTDSGVLLAVRTTCKDTREAKGKTDAAAFRPGFLPNIYKDSSLVVTEGAVGTLNYPVMEGPLVTNSTGNRKNDALDLINKLIRDEGRQEPVIFCHTNKEKLPENQINDILHSTTGFAYCITDVYGDNYKSVFENLGLKDSVVKDMDTKIKDNFLVIGRGKDCSEMYWFPSGRPGMKKMCDSIVAYNTRRDGIEKTPAFGYGEVLFYRDLWNQNYKTIERRAIESDAEIDELRKSLDVLKEQPIISGDKEAQKTIDDSIGKIERYKGIIKDKNDKIRSLSDKISELELTIQQLEKKLSPEDISEAQKHVKEVEEAVQDYLGRYHAFPEKKRDVIQWINDTFGDVITIHNDAKKSYENFMDRPFPLDKFCYAFVLLNAYTLKENGDLDKDVYDEIEKTWAYLKCDKSGFTESNAQKIPAAWIGSDLLDMHIKYGSNGDEIFRIYFYYDKNERKTIVGSMPDHLYYFTSKDTHNTRRNKV